MAFSWKSTGFGQHVVEGIVLSTTDAAILLQIDHGPERWIPRKVCLQGDAIEEGDEDPTVATWWLKTGETAVSSNGWIGVDLDGTLAEYDGWKGAEHIGAPVPAMADRVKRWLADGHKIKIFTARVSGPFEEAEMVREAVAAWCAEHIGQRLEVTCVKDYAMIELWDDRAVQVIPNTGEPVGKSTRGLS